MKMLGRILIVLSLVAMYCHCQDSFDTFGPIVKLSPARESQNRLDRFGFSVAAHQVEVVTPSDTLEMALEKTTILVGAPNGYFPGGISGLEYGYFACSETITNITLLMATTQAEREACFANATTGLIYRCNLNANECGALLGNGDAESADGNLFERSGNDPNVVTSSIMGDNGLEMKQDQLMGFNIKSSNGFFVACAPLWKHIFVNDNNDRIPQPRGRCVYSNRSLMNFIRINPCITGSGLNQNFGGYCTAGHGVELKQGLNEAVEILVGAPGRFSSRGAFVYYSNASSTSIEPSDYYKDATVFASVGGSDILVNRGYSNSPVTGPNVGYFGLSMTSGRILTTGTQFLVSAPRYTSQDFLGYVYVVPENDNYKLKPEMFIKGQQFAEMFGYSMAAVDLNNDGFDDAIIGAPVYYERDLPELGRIFIFENDQGNGFLNATIITGFAANSRFGSAITSLGDLNNDGYQDFAVSAPFEGSGVVYVYYGQESDSSGSIVNTQYAQRIDGGSFVNTVTNLTEVSTFGFSLSGNVDVDNNQYNDLVIGAQGSQTVFVLRSRPFASFTSTLTSIDEVALITFECLLNDAYYSCFVVTLCASYSGKGIADQFSTKFTLRETSRPTRLQFTSDPSSISITLPITFYGENNQTCVNVTAYIMNGTTSLDTFTLSADILNIERAPVQIDTNFVPNDLSTLPVISATTAAVEVAVSAECGSDDICLSNLNLEFVDTMFRTVGGTPTDDQTNLIVDDVQRVEINIEFTNTAEDAFNTFVTFSVPRQYFSFDQVSIENVRVTCDETTPANTTHDNRMCNVRTPLSMSAGRIPLVIRLSVNSLTGTEGLIEVPLSIMIGPNSTRNIENDLSDNSLTVKIPVMAKAQFTVAGSFGSDSITYQGNHTPVVENRASNLGESLSLTTTFRNNGPSNIQNAILTVYVPIRSDITGDYYYYYPASLSTSASASISCESDGVNPESYTVTNRRRRSTQSRRGSNRFRRQTTIIEPDVNCADTPDRCLKISCNITNLGRSGVDVNLLGYLDERFYNQKESTYTLQAYAVAQVLDTFFNTTGSDSEVTFTVTVSIQSLASSGGSIPWYIIAAPTAAALIFLVVLALLLYCFGFFKRRKGGKEVAGDEDEFDQFDSNPFGGTRKGSSKKDPELTKYEQKGKEE